MPGKRKCAWCGIGLGDEPGLPDGEVTHGVCPACKWRELARLGFPVSPPVTRYDCPNHCETTGQPAPEKCKHGHEQVGQCPK